MYRKAGFIFRKNLLHKWTFIFEIIIHILLFLFFVLIKKDRYPRINFVCVKNSYFCGLRVGGTFKKFWKIYNWTILCFLHWINYSQRKYSHFLKYFAIYWYIFKCGELFSFFIHNLFHRIIYRSNHFFNFIYTYVW